MVFFMKEILGQTGEKPPNLIFPIMALLAGILGGVFGIGGGMLISPLLLHIGIPPEVSLLNLFGFSVRTMQSILSWQTVIGNYHLVHGCR